MRNSTYAVVLSSLILQAACGDDGEGSATEPQPTTVTMTSTMPPTTATESAGTDSVGVTDTNDSTMGMSDSQTSNGPTPTTTDGPTTTNPISSTDPDTSTGPDTMSDPSTDPGETTSTTDPSGSSSSTDPSGSTSTSTTSDDTTGDGTTTIPDDTEDVPCSVQMATLNPIPPNIMVVLDKSGSMLTLWDHDANVNTPTITRWNSLHQVVSGIVNAFDLKVNFGMNLFPSKTATNMYDATACVVQPNVDVTVGPNKGTPIINAIPAANNMTIKGGTPASTGMAVALDHLKSLDPTIPRAVLFITDGAANCTPMAMGSALFEVYDQSLHTIVDNAFQIDKIPTYVVGIDISQMLTPNTQDGNPNGIVPYDKLNDVAVKGGKPKNDPNEKFYQANNQIELNAALDAIIADALSCQIDLDSEPAKPEFTEVEINGMEIPFVPMCNGMNGWTWVNPNGPYDSLVLCGTACTQLKMVGKADVNFFCSPG